VKRGEELFGDLMAASSRLQDAYFIAKQAGELELAQSIHRANTQIVMALSQLLKRFHVVPREEAS